MNKSAALPMQHADHAERRGLLLGLIGVAIFSQTLPFTRMAVAELDATFVALARAVLASVLALAMLAATGAFSAAKRPRGHQWWQLAVTAMGVV
ncbi:MAG: EamA family transporter, partial [Ralstonia sp.]|nr:EamA family transporter [Ralstonia sp.]